ncbi:C1 family peptidase [candidate division KSB1 bacterium]|nr:C1 family peptidase [candidate division KSB1 bacterium]
MMLSFQNVIVNSAYAQEGDISHSMLSQLKLAVKKSKNFDALKNAVSNNDLQTLALVRDQVGKIDHFYNVTIDSIGKIKITNQKSSGRCWLFTALNVLRLDVIKKYELDSFEFSETFCFFYDQLEKSNLFLEGVIDTRNLNFDDRRVEWLFRHPIGDGGVWNMAVALIEKYGVVPNEAMPETYHSENTSSMSRLLRTRLRQGGLKIRNMAQERKSITALREEKLNTLSDVYKILIASLGEPPDMLIWRYKDRKDQIHEWSPMTPLAFANQVIAGSLQDQVMLMNDPSREYYTLYEIEFDRNVHGQPNWTYINLPVNLLKEYAKKSLVDGYAMYFSCDVGKQLNRDEGILSTVNYDYESIYDIELTMNKEERIQTFDSGSSHAMTLVAVDTTASGATEKWRLENSWGAEKGHNGYLTMTDCWFDEYMFRLVVRKDYMPENVLKILEQKPIKLHPWDPMYLPFEDQ